MSPPPDALTAIRREFARTNHAGRTVSLLEGAAVVAGSVAVLAVRGRRCDAAMIGAIGALGLIDDLVEPRRRRGRATAKGLRGHLRAMRRGELTTGGLKILGIPLAALAGIVAAPGVRPGLMPAADAALVAGSANLANLLDLRPGRALKAVLPVALLTAAPPRAAQLGTSGTRQRDASGRVLACTALLAAAAAAPWDLRERGMLGDAGANTLGALAGAALTRRCPPAVRLAALAGVAALTLLSERVSFTAVIESTPALRALDRTGRRGETPREGAP